MRLSEMQSHFITNCSFGKHLLDTWYGSGTVGIEVNRSKHLSFKSIRSNRGDWTMCPVVEGAVGAGGRKCLSAWREGCQRANAVPELIAEDVGGSGRHRRVFWAERWHVRRCRHLREQDAFWEVWWFNGKGMNFRVCPEFKSLPSGLVAVGSWGWHLTLGTSVSSLC